MSQTMLLKLRCKLEFLFALTQQHQLIQGFHDLLPYLECSLLLSAPYTPKVSKLGTVEGQCLAFWVLCCQNHGASQEVPGIQCFPCRRRSQLSLTAISCHKDFQPEDKSDWRQSRRNEWADIHSMADFYWITVLCSQDHS